jgi:hypothetical protein
MREPSTTTPGQAARPRPDRDQEAIGGHLARRRPVDGDPIGGDEPAAADDVLDDAAARAGRAPELDQPRRLGPGLAAGRADLADHLAPVDREAAAVVAAIAAAGPRVVHRQVPQRLGRQRAVGDADAAGPTGLDQRGREAQVVGAGGGGQAGRAGAEDAQIVTSGHRAATVPR